MTSTTMDAEHVPDRLADLADQFITELRGGSDPTVEHLAQTAPEHEAAIRDLFPTIRTLERMRQLTAYHSGAPASLGASPPKQLGDFRLLREIGRGGMGVVFEAHQESLGRKVAIKILPRPLFSDQRRVARFQHEAQTAASLHHTHIVPVFGVGQHDGFHFYVMQRIDGSGLDKFLRGLRPGSWPIPHAPRAIWAAQVGAQAARALQYAHERGVLHRDIKPANLIIDATGKVWVTDFGLATALSSTDSEVVGTWRYMAPEQFEGRGEPRSDIFGLGLTLYEIVTGTVGGERELVEEGAVTNLVPPRQIDRSIPRDLEAIILKATAAEPGRRYDSAADFAEDLQRFLDGVPVRARPVTWIERGWRWARRNPMTASLSTLCATLLLACLAIGAWDYWRLSLAWQNESWSRSVAERNARVATSALDQIFSRFAAGESGTPAAGPWNETNDQPILSTEMASLLQELLAYYDRLAAEHADNPRTLRKAAEARRAIGDIHHQLGQHAQSAAAYQQALMLYQRFERNAASQRLEVVDTPVERAIRLAQLENGVGRAYQLLANSESAQNACSRALAALDALPPTDRQSPAVQYERARTLFLLVRRIRPGMGPNALPPSGPPQPSGESPDRQAVHLRTAVGILEGLVDPGQGQPAHRLLLAACLREQASDFLASRTPEDDRADAAATETLRKLCQEFPTSPLYQFELAQTLAEFSVFGDSLQRNQLETAEQRLRQALELLERLVAEQPQVAEYATAFLHSHGKLGTVLEQQAMGATSTKRQERLAESEKSFRRALQGASQLQARFPDSPGYGAWQALFQERLGTILRQAGRYDESYTVLARATRGLVNLMEQHHLTELRNQLARTYRSLAETCEASGKRDAARQARLAAEQLGAEPLRPDQPPGPRFRPPLRPHVRPAPPILP